MMSCIFSWRVRPVKISVAIDQSGINIDDKHCIILMYCCWSPTNFMPNFGKKQPHVWISGLVYMVDDSYMLDDSYMINDSYMVDDSYMMLTFLCQNGGLWRKTPRTPKGPRRWKVWPRFGFANVPGSDGRRLVPLYSGMRWGPGSRNDQPRSAWGFHVFFTFVPRCFMLFFKSFPCSKESLQNHLSSYLYEFEASKIQIDDQPSSITSSPPLYHHCDANLPSTVCISWTIATKNTEFTIKPPLSHPFITLSPPENHPFIST